MFNPLCLIATLALTTFLYAADAVGFLQPQQQADERAGYVDYIVTRSGSGAGAVSVDVLASGAGAALGVDYSAPQPGTLQWIGGDLTSKVVRLPLLHNPAFTYGCHLTLTLANAIGATVVPAASLVNLSVADAETDPAGTLVILADDAQGHVATTDDQGTLPLRVLRSGGLVGVQSITFGLADYDSQAGIDYAIPGATTLNWANGEGGVKTLNLGILSRAQARGTRTLYVLRTSSSSIPVGDGWTIAIADHLPALAGILVVPASVSVLESAGSATVTVGRSGGGSGAVSVQWTIVDDVMRDDSAQVGVNYSPVSGTLSWADGDVADKSVSVPLLGDGVPRPTLSSCIAFSNPTGGLLITASPINGNPQPGQAGCMLNILDDDDQGLLGFVTTSALVDELAGSVSFQVTRSNGSSGAVSVQWTTSSSGASGAIAGTDFTASSGTLNWANGDASARTITVPILHQAGAQLDRWFWIGLHTPTGGAGLDDGTPPRIGASVTIRDVDGGALDCIVPAVSAASVPESAGSVSVAFIRSGNGVGPASVQILVAAGTALPVLQYGSASATTLTWADGETGSKSLSVPIVANGVDHPAAFTVSAGVAYGNASVSLPNSTTITILDDAGTAAPSAVSSGDDGCGGGLTGIVLIALLACTAWRRPRSPLA